MRNQIQALVFDFGGVLSQAQDPQRRQEIMARIGIDESRFQPVYSRFREAFDNGQLSAHQYWQVQFETWGLVPIPEQIEECIRLDFESWTLIRTDLLALIKEFKNAGFRLGIISNMPPEFLVWIRQNFSWLSLFEVTVFSCDYGLSKPDWALYQKCLDRLQLEASQCLFTDDLLINVQAAAQMGFQTIRFQSVEQFKNDLKGVFDE